MTPVKLMDHSDEIERLKELYTHEYPLESGDINYIWHPRNPVSIYYRQAQERALVSMFNAVGLPLTSYEYWMSAAAQAPFSVSWQVWGASHRSSTASI